jgi:hypothetical protein
VKAAPRPRKGNPKRRKSPQYYEVKQGVYRTILKKLKGDDNAYLEEYEHHAIRDMLEVVLGGFDVRPILGIKPRRGAPPKNKGYGLALATHYYVFCDTEINEKTAASKVAHDWGLSLPAVRRIARENRVAYLEWMSRSRLPPDTPGIAQMRRAEIEQWIPFSIRTYR